MLLFSPRQDEGPDMIGMSLMEAHYESGTRSSRVDAAGDSRRGEKERRKKGERKDGESRNCLIIIPWTRVSPPDRIAQMRFSGNGARRQTRLPRAKGCWRAVVPVHGGFGGCGSALRLCVELELSRAMAGCCGVVAGLARHGGRRA